MTRIVTLYITAPLGAEYRRRAHLGPSGDILRKFPQRTGRADIHWPTLLLMLSDARVQVRLTPCPHKSLERRAYESLIRQIERHLDHCTEEERDSVKANDIRAVFSLWRKS